MIDELSDAELEGRLRVAYQEIVPKLIARTSIPGELPRVNARLLPVNAPFRRPRRVVGTIAAVLAIAVLIGGFAIASHRRTDNVPAASVNSGEPRWYQLLRPALPERFEYAAVTQASSTELWFVAIDPTVGQSLEITLSTADDVTVGVGTATVDATGTWVETDQGFAVRTATGISVTVSCDIGVRGRQFPGPPNYCDTAPVAPLVKSQIRAVAATVAHSFSIGDIRQPIGTPTTLDDPERVLPLIAAAVVGQSMLSNTYWGPADRVFDFAIGGFSARSPDTSVRLVDGLYPQPSAEAQALPAVYSDGAAFWMVTTNGAAIRISTTDRTPESLARLAILATTVARTGLGAPTAIGSTVAATLDPTTTSAIPNPDANTYMASTAAAAVLAAPESTALGASAPNGTPPVDCATPIPNVAGMIYTDAAAVISAAGYAIDGVFERTPAGSAGLSDAVIRQTPPPGAKVLCGAKLTVVVPFQPGPLYVIKQGDTYRSVAVALGDTVGDLLAFNGLTPNKLEQSGGTIDTPLDIGNALRTTPVAHTKP